MAELEARLDVIYRLQKKHRVNSNEELIGLLSALEDRLSHMSIMGEELEKRRAQSSALAARLQHAAESLSASRKKVVPTLEKTICSMLDQVSLPNAVFSVQLEAVSEGQPGPAGIDRARFLFSANKGVLPAEIGKTASGGELSRLMLCIKAAVADSMQLPVMIFDEIDTGISGETALKMGSVMKRLSKHHQLLAITHLPQIAGRGDSHFFVRKRTTAKRTVTEVVLLSAEERLHEVARMLSGEKPSAAALANAKELLAG
jgi:DNA repair protein RecN (Recombination protein N)